MNAYVDDAGKLVVREDIYGYDNRTFSALNGKYLANSERSQKVARGRTRRSAPTSRSARWPSSSTQQRRPQGGFFFPFFQ